MPVPVDSYAYHADHRKAVFATHCKADLGRWGINRVAESAAKEARARGFDLWEVWSPDERFIGSGVAADDLVD